MACRSLSAAAAECVEAAKDDRRMPKHRSGSTTGHDKPRKIRDSDPANTFPAEDPTTTTTTSNHISNDQPETANGR